MTLARSTTLRRLWIVGPCAVDAGLVDALAPIQALDELALIGLEATDAWLKPLARLDKLRTLTLMLPGIGDKGLEHVARAKGLTSLTLRELGTFVTGAGLRQLGTIEGLRRLSFGGARWGPRDLERAIGPDRLEELELRELRATRDEVVAVILRQTKLKALALDEVELSDAAFLRLAELEKLERLDLVHCLVSAAAVERFKKLRPECKVTFVPA